jgi:hypothetical protein
MICKNLLTIGRNSLAVKWFREEVARQRTSPLPQNCTKNLTDALQVQICNDDSGMLPSRISTGA